MNKELELWYRIVEYLKSTSQDERIKLSDYKDRDKDYVALFEGYPISIIETALLRLERLDNFFISKKVSPNDLDNLITDMGEDIKKLEAFHILIDKRVDVDFLIACFNTPLVKQGNYRDVSEEEQLEMYNTIIQKIMYIPDTKRYLNIDEFKLLKEMLICVKN